jgi:transposase InsO family protein
MHVCIHACVVVQVVELSPTLPFEIHKTVPRASDIPAILKTAHEAAGHRGSANTFRYINSRYHGITRMLCHAWCIRCELCVRRAVDLSKQFTVVRAIKSNYFMHRAQMDCFTYVCQAELVPTTHIVLHYHCHFTKWSILREIGDKEAQTVCDMLWRIWMDWGMPNILQSDNGGEFVNAEIKAQCIKYKVAFIHGRIYHPQSQGGVERGNGAGRKLVTVALAQALTMLSYEH